MKWTMLLLALLLILAGCSDDGDSDDGDDGGNGGGGGDGGDGGGSGGSGGDSGTPDPVALAVEATGIYPVNPAFSPVELHVPVGAPVEVTFTNNDPNLAVVHNWVVEGVDGAQTDSIGSGEAQTVTFTAPDEAGEHAFYCSVGDHRDRGMQGTLHVMAEA